VFTARCWLNLQVWLLLVPTLQLCVLFWLHNQQRLFSHTALTVLCERGPEVRSVWTAGFWGLCKFFFLMCRIWAALFVPSPTTQYARVACWIRAASGGAHFEDAGLSSQFHATRNYTYYNFYIENGTPCFTLHETNCFKPVSSVRTPV
jgi:hypothetical protein